VAQQFDAVAHEDTVTIGVLSMAEVTQFEVKLERQRLERVHDELRKQRQRAEALMSREESIRLLALSHEQALKRERRSKDQSLMRRRAIQSKDQQEASRRAEDALKRKLNSHDGDLKLQVGETGEKLPVTIFITLLNPNPTIEYS
jgi:hypothetical protein